jgi:polysaccharide chain length determinant protein (PEP-CTERM system associated)
VDGVELEIGQMQSQLEAVHEQLRRVPATRRALTSDGKPVLTPLEARLAGLRKELDAMLLKYTEAHPKVIETRASIAELERQRGESREQVPTMANPEYRQLELRRKEIESGLAGLRTKRQAYLLRVEELQKQMETLPLVEDELQRLTRDYEAIMKNYKDLVARRDSMSMSESVELNSEDMRFRVIEPPNVSVDSVLDALWKKALKLMSAVLVVGLGGGLALAYGLSQIRPAVYSQRALIALTGLPVYGVVSLVPTFRVRMRGRLDLMAFGVASVLLVVAYAAALALQYGAIYEVEVPLVGALTRPIAGHG